MSGMGDGYVGTAQDAARIRRLEKQREAERKRIQDLKKKSAEGQGGLLQFGSGTSEVCAYLLSSSFCPSAFYFCTIYDIVTLVKVLVCLVLQLG